MPVLYKAIVESTIEEKTCKFHEYPDKCIKYEMECQCPWTPEEQTEKRCYISKEV